MGAVSSSGSGSGLGLGTGLLAGEESNSGKEDGVAGGEQRDLQEGAQAMQRVRHSESLS